jgi:hypothetical protein
VLSPRSFTPAANDQGAGARLPERIAGRYAVRSLLGRGGMAIVYSVVDESTGRALALKQMLSKDSTHQAALAGLFENEYRTLAELEHPRVIAVHDYGLAEGGAYYTMELLDGGDLTRRAPLPWQEACTLMYDVCSSLALLHSRRLVHRDVTPHNVRCTQDGHAKLIDFGAMTRMGSAAQAVGTPPFVAPEVAHRSTVDGRADLFSLGATLYFVLTGRVAYPARSFGEVVEAWKTRPSLPSALMPGIPARLDALVMSLLSMEPALRPRTASEVMQQLVVLAGLEPDESLEVSRAYLSTPRLVGRDKLLATFERLATRKHGSGLMLEGVAGSGRSRALEACVMQARSQGAIALRAGAKVTGARPFAMAEALASQLLEAIPDVALAAARASGAAALLIDTGPEGDAAPAVPPRIKTLSAVGNERGALHQAYVRWFLAVAGERRLLIAADDVDRVDAASGGWLATLADAAKRHHLLMLFTTERDERAANSDPVVSMIAQRCTRIAIEPLSAEQTEQLFDSVFGDVPHVAMLSEHVFRVAQGNPRACMDLTQHLVDCGVVNYDGGTWTLPVRLAADDLPDDMTQAFAARVAKLTQPARWLAQCHALSAYGSLTLADHAALLAGDHERASSARSELLSHGVLVGDGELYSLASDAWLVALNQSLDGEQRVERHIALASLGESAAKLQLPTVHHLLSARLTVRALDLLAIVMANSVDRGDLSSLSHMTTADVVRVFEQALRAAEVLRRSEREIADLQRWVCMMSVAADEAYFARIGPAWRKTLLRDSGFDDWQDLTQVSQPGERLKQALGRAGQRYATLPQSARAYPPDEAIKHLVHYVLMSFAIGSRLCDGPLIRGLPGLLQPFVGLSPAIAAILQNALATCDLVVEGRLDQAHARWLDVFTHLDQTQTEDRRYVDTIRHAIAFALGSVGAWLGLASTSAWADLLDRDPLHKVNAMYLRKLVRLQQGDWEGAERYRREAELLALQANSRQMFTSTLSVELVVHALAHDLTGVQQIADRIEPWAARYEGWLPYRHLADGYIARLRGDLPAARDSLERALALSAPDANAALRSIKMWPWIAGAYCEVLVELGCYQESRDYGLHTLEQCRERDNHNVEAVIRGLSLAEAKLGDYAQASARLDALIERQRNAGVSGLHLGATYEARARIALWANDLPAFEAFSRLTATEYRHGQGSRLGARYESLIEEARQAGVHVPAEPSAVETSILATANVEHRAAVVARIELLMRAVGSRAQRAQQALRLICEATAADAGHLYLITSQGPVWTASQPAAGGGDAQFALACECVEHAFSDESNTTRLMTEAATIPWVESAARTRIEGVWHQPLLITCSSDHELRHVAVVVLVAPAHDMGPHKYATLGAIGKCLLEAGDTPGVVGLE